MLMQMKEIYTEDRSSWQAAVDAIRVNAEAEYQELQQELRQVRKELEEHEERCRWELELRPELKGCKAKVQAGVCRSYQHFI